MGRACCHMDLGEPPKWVSVGRLVLQLLRLLGAVGSQTTQNLGLPPAKAALVQTATSWSPPPSLVLRIW